MEPTVLFAGRYAIAAQQDERVEATDRQPWKRCWSCGATDNEAGEAYCTSCGASLAERSYSGTLSATLTGLALVTQIADDAALALLPVIWDQVTDDGMTLTLLRPSGRAAVQPPVAELDALTIAHGLGQLLTTLHHQGYRLGTIAPADIELAGGAPQLRDAPGLHRAADGEGVADDLAAIAALLEALTATPRTTRRLEEGEELEPALLPRLLSDLRTGQIADAPALLAHVGALLDERATPKSLHMRFAALSDTGMVRDLDEDSLLALELTLVRRAAPQTWGLFIVADGMGGHSAGEVASDVAIRGAYEVVQSAYLAPTVDQGTDDDEELLRETARQAIVRANEYVLREATKRGNDMGTTMTMALVSGDRAVIGNIGDSRTYLYRDGKLSRISKDHSLVQRLVDIGQIAPDDVYTHPQRNAVLRSLGDKNEIQVDIFSQKLKPGDALLLTSDGQWEMTRDPQMEQILAAHPSPVDACAALIAAANAAGGEDNITAVLIQFSSLTA